MGIEYKREFFDRDYTIREAYGRVWRYARRYRFRLVVGIVSGMLTAGTLVPLFQVIQPTLQNVSRNEVKNVLGGRHVGCGNVGRCAEQDGFFVVER